MNEGPWAWLKMVTALARTAGSASERARASVTGAVRQAITRIGQHHSPLGKHLGQAIHTGAYRAYLPNPRVALGMGHRGFVP